MKEQLSNTKDQKGRSMVMPKRENGEVGSDIGPPKHEPHHEPSHRKLEPSRFDFNTMPIFPSSKPNADLPRNLQNKLEAAFGEDFSKVAIQKNSQEASKLNALAFTQGDNMNFAPGQFNPNSEKGKYLIGHEFTHIVQQRNKAVGPTHILGKGWALNEDKSLENEADSLGKKAILGEPIAQYQSPSLGIRNSLRTVQAKSNVIQRAIKTWGGEWDTEEYKLRKDKDHSGTVYPAATGVRGVDMLLKFTPNTNVDATLIGLTQTAQSVKKGAHPYIDSNPGREGRAITTGTERGTMIDRMDARNNPIYGSASLGAGKGLEDTAKDNNPTGDPTVVGNPAGSANATYQMGFRFKSGATWKSKDAKLFDGPTLTDVTKDSKQTFETTALALKGNQKDTYYGSVQWGWQTDSAGKFSKIPFKVVSQGVPSSTFMKAAGIWNAAKDSTGAETVDLPIVDVKVISNLAGVNIGLGPVYTHLPIGTRVVEISGFPSMTETYIRVVDGSYTGETGKVDNSDIKDEGK